MTVGITDVATDLVLVLFRRRVELSTPGGGGSSVSAHRASSDRPAYAHQGCWRARRGFWRKRYVQVRGFSRRITAGGDDRSRTGHGRGRRAGRGRCLERTGAESARLVVRGGGRAAGGMPACRGPAARGSDGCRAAGGVGRRGGRAPSRRPAR